LADDDGGFAAKRLPLAPSLRELHTMVVAAFGLAPTTKLQLFIGDGEDPFIKSGKKIELVSFARCSSFIGQRVLSCGAC
jgi:hypothetical protein